MSEMPDDYCGKIFWFLFLNGKCRFNELHKRLNRIGVKISKPTLIAHLGHLQDKEYIVRKQFEKQNISYEVNLKKFEFLKETAQHKKLLLTLDKSKKIFQSFPPREQLANLVDIMALYVFQGIKNDVYSVLEPEKRGENQLGFWFFFKTLDIYRVWFLETFKKSDEKTRNMLTEKINGGIEMLTNDIFDFNDEKN